VDRARGDWQYGGARRSRAQRRVRVAQPMRGDVALILARFAAPKMDRERRRATDPRRTGLAAIASVHRPRNSHCCSAANDRAPRPQFGRVVARNGRQAKSIGCQSKPNDRAASTPSGLAQAGRFRPSALVADSVHNLRAACLSYCRSSGYRDRAHMRQAMRRPPR